MAHRVWHIYRIKPVLAGMWIEIINNAPGVPDHLEIWCPWAEFPMIEAGGLWAAEVRRVIEFERKQNEETLPGL